MIHAGRKQCNNGTELGVALMTTLQQTMALMTTLALLVLIYLLQPILMPFLAGLVIGYLGDPLVDRFERFGLSRTFGSLLVFLVFFSVFTALMLIVLPILAREITSLLTVIPVYFTWLQGSLSPWLIDTFGIDPFNVNIEEIVAQLGVHWQQAGGALGAILVQASSSSFALIGYLGLVGLTPVVAFYLMRDWDYIVARIREILPRDSEPTIVKLSQECDEVLSAFLRGQLLIMFLLGCIYSIGLYLVGLDLAIMIGMLAGLASIVPYLGFFVGIIAAAIAAIFQFQDLIFIVYVAIVFGVGQALEGWILTPWLVGEKIGLHPVAVIFAVLAGGQLYGFIGVLLALPVAAVIMVFIRHMRASYLSSHYYENSDGSSVE